MVVRLESNKSAIQRSRETVATKNPVVLSLLAANEHLRTDVSSAVNLEPWGAPRYLTAPDS